MREHFPSQDVVEAGHEPDTTSVKGLVIIGVSFLAAAIVIHILVYYLMKASADGPLGSVAPLVETETPPGLRGPILQPSPAEDLRAFRRAQQAKMTSYGWVDQDAGIVRLPVDRAIELAAERGWRLPPAGAETPPASPPAGREDGPEGGQP